MELYQKMYTTVFNGVTDALEALEQWNIGQAKALLRQAQIDAEALYIHQAEETAEAAHSA